jgi:hypothetical protein
MRLTPMPSPSGRNTVGAFLSPSFFQRGRGPMAYDEWPNGSREQIERVIRQRLDDASDQEVEGLLSQLTDRRSGAPQGHGASVLDQLFASSRSDLPDRAKIEGQDDEETAERRANFSHFLRGKGLSEDDIRTACDLSSLGPGRSGSAVPGGGLASGFGGALHSAVRQPSSSPPARDRTFMTDEERSGQCAYAGGDRRRSPGRDSFDEIYGRQDRLVQIAEATRRRRPPTANQIAMDSKRRENFAVRFPGGERIRGHI